MNFSLGKRFVLGTLLGMLSFCSFGQEFNLDVKVSAPASFISDQSVFDELQDQLTEFFNSNSWTEDSFEDHEKITGNIALNISSENTPGVFKGELIIQTSRPIFNSNVSSPVMRYSDKDISFSFNGLQQIRRTEDGYIDNFSSILSFFAYYMLAMDYDTFSPLGGDVYFEKAFSLYNALPSNLQRADPGWTSNDKRQQNRFFLIDNARSPRFRKYREAMYSYHRNGLDKMYDDVIASRQVVLDAITSIGQVNQEVNNTILPRMFSDTKRIEIIDIFIISEPDEKTKVRSIMLSIDPSQTIAYRDLR